jgi:hypothetical protein
MMFILGTNIYGLENFTALIVAELGIKSVTISQLVGLAPTAAAVNSVYSAIGTV